MSLVASASRSLQRLEETLLAAAILTIATLTILNVVCRALLGFSLAMTEEVSQFCIIVVCFVGLSYAASQGRHIRMTAIYDLMPRPIRKLFMIVVTSVTALLMWTLAYFAWEYVSSVRELGGIYPVTRIPFYVIYLIAPLGLALTGVHYALAAWENLRSPRIYVAYDKLEAQEEPVMKEI